MFRNRRVNVTSKRNKLRRLLIEVLEIRRVFACPAATTGADYLVCDNSDDGTFLTPFNALAGDDTVLHNGGNDHGTGGPGRDQIYGGPGNDIVKGGADDDYLVMGDEGDDNVYGDRGNDGDLTFVVTAYAVNGGIGNDNVFGGDGNDVVRGGQGDDRVFGDDDPNGPQLSPVATGNDAIFGDLGNDQLWGQGGADTFHFGIESAGAVDSINDWTPSQGDRINLTALDAQPGNALATGVITDFGSLTMVQVGGNTDITLPTGQRILLVNTIVANVLPSYFIGKASIDRRGNDNLQASSLGEQLNGREGDDVVTGGTGIDNLNGNTGRDRVFGGQGNDIVQGGADDDFVVMGDEGDDTVSGNRGNDGDMTFAVPTNAVNGGIGNDNVFGGDGNDVVRGGQGDDLVYGDDDPNGPQSSPVATGNDWISGDLGNDQLWGQGGADTFYFGVEGTGIVDTIHDWTPSQGDRIDLTAFDAQPGDAFATGVITDFGSLSMLQVGGNTEITLPTGQKIVLVNTTITNVQPSQFLGKASIDRRGVDNLLANPAGEQLNGRESDDTLTGGAGPDNLNGNVGRDYIYGGLGNDIVKGGADNDYVVMGDDGDDWVYGDRGNDGDLTFVITATAVNGGLGNDRVFGGDGNDVVRGGQGDDLVYGDDDPQFPQGGTIAIGNDWIAGDLGSDQLWGQGGADTFYFGVESIGILDVIHDWTPSEGDRIDLTSMDAQLGNAFATGVITDFGSLTLLQVGADTEIALLTGQKILLKNTVVSSVMPAHFIGKASIDRRGIDTIQANDAGEQLAGREGDDIVLGGVGADHLNGNLGRDRVDGGLGNDIVRGGKDDDIQIWGGPGDDAVYGDLGNDAEVNGNQGSDKVYGGPGDDVVRGGADNDIEVFGDDGNDFVYGDEGDDAHVNGNKGNDHVYGGNGNDTVRGGQNDDYVSGDAGDDKVYGDLGTNILVGGPGKDTFFVANGFNIQNTITDFERGQDRIDVSAFAELGTYEQIVLIQEGSNTVIQFAPTNKLIIQGQTPTQIKSTDFVGPWSAKKATYLWAPGILHDHVTKQFATQGGANATTPTGEPVIKVAEYRINGFNPLANLGNIAPHKPFQLIDLRSVSVSSVTWRQDGNDTVVDLDPRFGKVLRLVGVNASQVTRANFLTVGQDEKATIDAYLADWTDRSQIQSSVVPPSDRFFIDQNRVIYESSPTMTNLVNLVMPQASTTARIVRLDPNGPQLQFVDDFNPANPLHKIDLTGLGISQLSELGFEQVANETKINFPNGKSLVLTYAERSDVRDSTFIGWSEPEAYRVFAVQPSSSEVTISGFDPSNRADLLDFSAFMRGNDFSQLTVTAQGADSFVKFNGSDVSVKIENVSPTQITADRVLSGFDSSSSDDISNTIGYDTLFGGAGTDSLFITIPNPNNRGPVNQVFVSKRPDGTADTNGVGRAFADLQEVKLREFGNDREVTIDRIKSGTQAVIEATNEFIETMLELSIPKEGTATQAEIDATKRVVSRVNTFRKATFFSALTLIDAPEDLQIAYDRVYSRMIDRNVHPDVARDFARYWSVAEVSSYLGIGKATQVAGTAAGGFLGNVPGAVIGAGVGSAIGDEIKRGIQYSDRINELADYYATQVQTHQGSYDDFDTYYTLPELGEEDQRLLDTLPVGATIASGQQFLTKERDSTLGVVVRSAPLSRGSATHGEGVDPSHLAPPPAGTDLDSENGAYFTYAEGVHYKWDGSRWNPLPRGTDITKDPEFDSNRVRYANKDGNNAEVKAPEATFDVSAVVSNAVSSFYNRLTKPSVGQGGTVVPSLIVGSASDAAGTFLASMALNGDFDAAIKQAKDQSLRTLINGVRDHVLDNLQPIAVASGFARESLNGLFQTDAFAGNIGISIAKTIGEQLIRGEFDDSFASNVVTQSLIGAGIQGGVSWAADQLFVSAALEGNMTAAIAQGLGSSTVSNAFVAIGFDPVTFAATLVISTLLNEFFSEEIAAVSKVVGDVGEFLWDNLRDPIGSLRKLFKDDPKFTPIDGSSGVDFVYLPSLDRKTSDLKGDNDTLFGGDGWAIVLAGPGDDIIAHGNRVPGGGVPGNGIGELYGEGGADFINAGGSEDELYGGGGADILIGGADFDRLVGGDSPTSFHFRGYTGDDEGDYLDGGLGNDWYTGNAGRDTFVVTLEPNAEDRFLDFKPGEDWVDLSQFSSINDFGDVQIVTQNGKTTLLLPNNQRVIFESVTASALQRGDFIFTQFGTSGPDVLLGSDSVEIFNGLEGNDDLRLGGGNDIANGNQGDDQIAGGAGDDQLRGGRDNDTISGGEGKDVIQGDLGNDLLNGNQGSDRVDGGPGNDEVRGGRDDDEVIGGEGDDKLYGDLGNDVLLGGPGADEFFLTLDPGSTDYIQDFSLSQGDKLTLAGFASSPISAADVVQVGYDTYIFFPNNQRAIIRFADASVVRSNLGLVTGLNTPADQAAPTITGVSPTVVVNRTALVRPAQQAKIDDADSPELSGGKLAVNVQTGTGTLAIQPASGSAVTTSGNRVNWNGFEIGSFQTTVDGKSLTVDFGANAVPVAIEAVAKEIAATNIGNSATIVLSLTDGDGGTSNVVASSIEVNDAPTDILLSNTSIAENSPMGAIVGSLATVDPNSGNTFSYSFVSGQGSEDNSKFNIDGQGVVRVIESFDFEADAEHSIRVRATDQGGLFHEKSIKITVANVVELTRPAQIGDGSAQRSVIRQLVLDFDDVLTVEPGAFVVQQRTNNSGVVSFVDVTTQSNLSSMPNGKTRVTLTFSGPLTNGFGALADGNYQLTVTGSKVQSLTNNSVFDGNADGVAGGDYTFGSQLVDSFFALFGDSDGNGEVGSADLARAQRAFGKRVGDAGFNAAFDFDGNSEVGSSELLRTRRAFTKKRLAF